MIYLLINVKAEDWSLSFSAHNSKARRHELKIKEKLNHLEAEYYAELDKCQYNYFLYIHCSKNPLPSAITSLSVNHILNICMPIS